MTRLLLAALLLTIAFGAASCNTTADDTQAVTETATPEIIERQSDTGSATEPVATAEPNDETGSQSDASSASGATSVSRLPATATPTQPPDPLSLVGSSVLPDIVVPLGAELLKHAMATDSTDASADYVVADIDGDTLFAWFREHMADNGWVEDEERDGALIFLHEDQLSARYADDEAPRTATVFFGTVENLPEGSGSFTIVVEEPYVDDGSDDESTGTDDGAEADDDEETEEGASSDEG